MFCNVAGENLAVDTFDIAECQSAALDDVVLGQEAEFGAGLGV